MNKQIDNNDTLREGALSDIKVIDLSTAAAAPYISTHLADFGAEVIKVEKPIVGDPIRSWGEQRDGISLYWQALARGKKCITLDLRTTKGRELLLKLCESADIIVENFRPGTLEKWDLGPEVLHEANSQLIIMRLTGFGQDGPYSKKPGFGTLAEAMSGFSYTTGLPDGPPTLPALPLGDGIAGIFGAYAVMVALHARNTTKVSKGQVLDLALYEPILRLLESNTLDYDQLGIIRERNGNQLPQTTPRNTYKTLDDTWVVISGSTPATAERILKAIGRSDLLKDPKFSDNPSRRKNAKELDSYIAEWISQRYFSEVMDTMDSYEVAIAPVYSVKDVVEDPHFSARETIIKVHSDELDEVALHNVTPKMSLTPGEIRWAGPALGKHNMEIYCEELKISYKEFLTLQEEGII